MLTSAPCRSSSSSNLGIAGISFEPSSAATWAKLRCCAVAQALTKCNGPSWRLAEPRSVLPSMAICRTSRAAAIAAIQSWKQAWKARGSMRSKTRSKVSCDGTPWRRGRKRRNQSRRLRAKSSISCQSSQLPMTAQTAMIMMSRNRCRHRRRRRHRFLDIIIIAVCAVIGNCDDWQEIELFARSRLDWFRRFLPLRHGVPSHDTFERVFDRIDPRAFQACFQDWIAAIAAALDVRQIAIDGKTLRGSASRQLGPLHLVSAWATAQHLSLAQVAADEGSNEIPAIPKLLELLDLHGALVSIDAAGCHKAIAQKILDRGGDYVLVVKDNQPKLLAAIQEQMGAVFDGVVADYSEQRTRDRGHGREERRIYTTRPAPPELRAEWP